MNSKSNGKLIAGLMIMFVVAVSIVGVTYAYFVSDFTGNQKNTVVTITAGKLIAKYNQGTALVATNVVPGWLSDGLHYYDVDVAAANKGRIYATKALESAVGTGYATTTYGIAAPVTFTVTNNSDVKDSNTAVNYIINLHVKENGILNAMDTTEDESLKAKYEADANNLLVSLYRGEFDADATNFGGELISGPFVVGDSGDIQLATGAPEVVNAVGETKNYFVMFEYINDKCSVQPSQGVQLDVEVLVSGVQKDNDPESDKWYDDNNAEVDWTKVPTAVTSTYLKTCTVDEVSVTNESALIPAA